MTTPNFLSREQVRDELPSDLRHSVIHDARQWSRYVGGFNLVRILHLARFMVSGLHVELKFWSAAARREAPVRLSSRLVNDTELHAWAAMSRHNTARTSQYPRHENSERQEVFRSVRASLRGASFAKSPVVEHDEWALDTILKLREQGLLRVNVLAPWTSADHDAKAPELGVIGLAQEFVNVFVKNEFCWQSVGEWERSPRPGRFHPHLPEFPLHATLCALHAPADQGLLDALGRYALGRFLQAHGLLIKQAGRIVFVQASDASPRPWFALDCLETYYALQLILRRLAMLTWPERLQRRVRLKACRKMFDRRFRGPLPRLGPDWLTSALELPEDIFRQTLDELEHHEKLERQLGDIKERPDRNTARDIMDL